MIRQDEDEHGKEMRCLDCGHHQDGSDTVKNYQHEIA